ncbi:DegT/DnrJ/EryC1/StrS family aminotransferase [Akkermansiaceae bacterium]|nr:DegT/DnrJ/EryC1/StrS family aminotransferase [Akkermansiaceae bacterium]MDA7933547.1 DegT/DnrJ/EryC1/StrS family aminotransferase [Akkermansiaceae bacterium]MDB4423429.1 DegT/DnrJ/EryC1/StrS family aminotransferase [bacterium]
MSYQPIYVTQPSLAPLEEYTALLKEVWESGILTHNGPMVRRLETEMCDWLNISHCSVVSNGTIALQMAIKALQLKGEIITTPFTWVATLSAIKWEGCTPVFCDIEADTFNIDSSQIEAAITDQTVAIMPVHVFGNPCDVEAIEAIARKHGLKVIYDAAHAIGSTYNGKSVLECGDISATSLHATKLFNTAEGGACITTDDALAGKLERIRFFGHNDAKEIVEDGFNGKLTEVHAALGLANLEYGDEVLADRKQKYQVYLDGLSACEGLTFQRLKIGEPNYSYFPVVFESENQLLRVENALNALNIFPRRYFYPSVNLLNEIVDYAAMPVSEDISRRILCLPLYWKLQSWKILDIIKLINSIVGK